MANEQVTMSQSKLKELPPSTVRLIGSSQVIVSTFSVVKELIENALDANATTIDIKLENFGLDKVEVRDNGDGIASIDVPFATKRFATSKISGFADLLKLASYGFRGESLGSLCSVSDVTMTTKTSKDDVALTYIFSDSGEIAMTQPSHMGKGTTVCACNLFMKLPVRRQYYNTIKKKKEELKKVEDLVIAFGAIHPALRLTLCNHKDLIWQKNSSSDIRSSLSNILGRNLMSQMMRTEFTVDPKIHVELYMPQTKCDLHLTSRSSNDRCFSFVNKRPVHIKIVEKFIKEYYNIHHNCSVMRFPVFLLSMTIPPFLVDFNVNPNKTTVGISGEHEDSIINGLSQQLKKHYSEINVANIYRQTEITDNSAESERCLSTTMSADSIQCLSATSSADSVQCLGATSSADSVQCLSATTSADSVQCLSATMSAESRQCLSATSSADSVQSSWSDVTTQMITAENVNDNNIESPSHETEQCSGNGTEHFVMSRSSGSSNHMASVDQVKQKNAPLENMNLESEASFLGFGEKNIHKKISRKDSVEEDFDIPESQISFDLVGDDLQRVIEEKSSFYIDRQNMESNIDTCSEKTNMPCDNKKDFAAVEAEQWTKGHSMKSTCGATLQPVTLLAAREPSGPTSKTTAASSRGIDLCSPHLSSKRKSIALQEDQPTLYDLVTNKPVKRLKSGNIPSSDEISSTENPDAEYDEINKIVEMKQKNLPYSKGDKYEESGQSKRMTEPLKKSKVLSSKIKRKSQLENTPSIIEKLLESSKSVKDKRLIKSVQVPLSMITLKKRFSTLPWHSPAVDQAGINVIGCVKTCGVWFCSHDNKIALLNHHRVAETVLYYRLISNFVMTAETLDQPIKLTERNVNGADMWETLLQLVKKSSSNMSSSLLDNRFVGNGIDIRFHSGTDGDVSVMVHGLSKSPVYDVSDVLEVLSLITKSKAQSLAQSRPLKAIAYLQGEAMRMARKLPTLRSQVDIEELLDQMQMHLPKNCDTCLHSKPFLHSLYNMDDLPFTQTLTQ